MHIKFLLGSPRGGGFKPPKPPRRSATDSIGFPGQFRRFVIPFDEGGVIQIREINLGHEIRSWNLYFGHSKFALRSRNLAFTSFKLKYASRAFKFATGLDSV